MTEPLTTETDDAGYTLLEVSVATALLVSVLLPTLAVLLLVSGTPRPERQAVALGLAQAELEAVREHGADAPPAPVDPPWVVEREVWHERGALGVRAVVRYGPSEDALATLWTLLEADEPGRRPPGSL